MKIGLALSGGGALGAAHIGVIEELEKAGIKVDLICGVSGGALIGLAYAIGGMESLASIYNEVSRSKLFTKQEYLLAAWPDKALVYLASVLKKHGALSYDSLKIKFSCVATDVATGKKKIFSSGDPVKSVLASSAYPGVFSIQKIGERFYFDGAVSRNLPAEETRSQGADFVIGSSIYSLKELADKEVRKMNRIAVLIRSLDIFEYVLSQYQEKQCDFCFEPHVEPFRWFDFSRIEKIREIGREYAAREIANLKKALNKC